MSSTQWRNEQGNDDQPADRERPLLLLAEDNDETRRVYCLILRHYGYRVAEATTGPQAVDVTRTLRPSLVLMDIGLPELDGFQASRLLKSDAATHGIPLIAFSARIDSTADLVSGSPTFDGFILKPVSPRELVHRVDAYLSLLRGVPAPERRPRAGHHRAEQEQPQRGLHS